MFLELQNSVSLVLDVVSNLLSVNEISLEVRTEIKTILYSIGPIISNLILFIILVFSSVFSLKYIFLNKTLLVKKYRITALDFWAIILLSLYTSFAFVGEQYFFPRDNILWTFSFQGITLYILGFLLSFINYIVLIEKLRNYSFNPTYLPSKKEAHKFYWQSVIIFLFIGFIYWVLCYPANSGKDTQDVLEMIERNSYNTHHTILYPVILAFLLFIVDSIAFLSFVQILSFSLIYSLWLKFFYEQGYSKKHLLLVFGLLYLLPINGTLMVTLFKDIPYTQSLILLSYMLLQFYLKDNLEHNKLFLCLLGLVLSSIGMIRFNGVGVVVTTMILLSIRSFQRKNITIGLLPLLTIVFSFFLVNVIFFKTFKFKDTASFHKASLIIQPIATAHIYKIEDSLHPELLKQTRSVHENTWKKTSPYYNAYTSVQNDEELIKAANNFTKDTATFLKNYLYTWIKSPLIHFRTRLNYISVVWSRSSEYTFLVL